MAKNKALDLNDRLHATYGHRAGRKRFNTTLALKDEITKALTNWSAQTIWELLTAEKKIDYSYSSFLKHLRQLNLGKPLKPKPKVHVNPALARGEDLF